MTEMPPEAPRETRDKSYSRDSPRTAPRKGRATIDDKLRESLSDTYQMLGLAIITIAMPTDDEGLAQTGVMITERADAAADAWIDVADKNPKVKTALRKFTEGSAFAGLFAIHLSMFAPVLASRGILPPQIAALLSSQRPAEPSPNGAGVPAT
jgi:hypothetical protein